MIEKYIVSDDFDRKIEIYYSKSEEIIVLQTLNKFNRVLQNFIAEELEIPKRDIVKTMVTEDKKYRAICSIKYDYLKRSWYRITEHYDVEMDNYIRSKKFKIDGPGGESLALYYSPGSKCYVGCRRVSKAKPFLDHICFSVLEFKPEDILSEGVRQSCKFRYYFDPDDLHLTIQFDKLRTKYNVEAMESIYKIC